jgi:hypothetical protein
MSFFFWFCETVRQYREFGFDTWPPHMNSFNSRIQHGKAVRLRRYFRSFETAGVSSDELSTGTVIYGLVLLAFAGEPCYGSFLETAASGCYATVAYP